MYQVSMNATLLKNRNQTQRSSDRIMVSPPLQTGSSKTCASHSSNSNRTKNPAEETSHEEGAIPK
jgi:hypothetical protein